MLPSSRLRAQVAKGCSRSISALLSLLTSQSDQFKTVGSENHLHRVHLRSYRSQSSGREEDCDCDWDDEDRKSIVVGCEPHEEGEEEATLPAAASETMEAAPRSLECVSENKVSIDQTRKRSV